jgi:hypothetical protein
MKPEKFSGDLLEQEFECPRRDDLGTVETPYDKQVVVAGDQVVAPCGQRAGQDIVVVRIPADASDRLDVFHDE